MTATRDPGEVCPCGSGRPFGACCEPLLNGQRSAVAARELMRSRYTAHAIGDEAYLHRTCAHTARQPFSGRRKSGPRVTWTRLVIHGDQPGPSPDTAYVEFSAHFRDAEGEHVMRERSEFRRENGSWLYTRAI